MALDTRDRLWLLDHAKIEQNPIPPGGSKLVGIDLQRDQILQKILFPESVAAKSTLNDDVALNRAVKAVAHPGI